MFYKLITDQHIFKFSCNNSPALRVHSGDTVEIETMDCFSNQLQKQDDSLEKMDWEKVNPATGPIYIEEARPGQVLKVTIEAIKVNTQGVMAAGKDMGPLGSFLDVIDTKIIPIIDNLAYFDEDLLLPLNPMVGVIGVAPSEAYINTGTPGSHGGNMDNAMIATGAVLYLPVFHEGALFALGDLHAAMGDGEIGETGIEIAGSVKVKLEVLDNFKLSNPILENNICLSTIASAKTIDEATDIAAMEMFKLLRERINLKGSSLAMLMSAVGNSQICQIVDPLKTARFVMPKWVLEKYKFKL